MQLSTSQQRLVAVTTRGTTSTSLFEFAALGAHIWLDVGVGDTSGTKVLDSLTGLARTLQQDSVLALGSTESKLIKGDALATGSQDTLASTFSEAQSANGQLWHFEDTNIISDGANDDSSLGLVALGRHVVHQLAQAQRRAVDTRHKQTLQHNLVERGIGTASQEAVKLDQEAQIRILRLGGVTASLLGVLVLNINTHRDCGSSNSRLDMYANQKGGVPRLAAFENSQLGHLAEPSSRWIMASRNDALKRYPGPETEVTCANMALSRSTHAFAWSHGQIAPQLQSSSQTVLAKVGLVNQLV
eukprot:m.11401 g.11401  ORF g.11401 m.11401 type:complete len:301 (+) comp9808_c0_seq1:119-1021(+)